MEGIDIFRGVCLYIWGRRRGEEGGRGMGKGRKGEEKG